MLNRANQLINNRATIQPSLFNVAPHSPLSQVQFFDFVQKETLKLNLSDSAQLQNKKTKTRLLKSTVYFKPRLIFPIVFIVHNFDHSNHIQECSVCGYNVVKLRYHACKMINCKPKYTHTIPVKKKVSMQLLISQLICPETKSMISQETKDLQTTLYFEWLKKGRQSNFIQGIRKDKAAASLIEQKASNQMINILDNQINLYQQKLKTIKDYDSEIKKSQYYQLQLKQQQQKFAEEVWEQFYPILKTKIKSQIVRSLTQTKSITLHEKSITFSNLNKQLQKFYLPSIYGDWKSKVNQYIRTNKLFQKSSRHSQTKLKACQFLKQIPPLFFQSKNLLIQTFRIRPTYIQKASNYILKEINKIFELNIPDISASLVKKGVKRKKNLHDIHTIKRLVYELINQKKFVLAVDLWFCFCLGLRLKDLLKVKIQNLEGIFFDMIVLTESKNNHQTCRCIPSSLKKLVAWSKQQNTYPITVIRLKSLISYCKEKLGGFYILRHSLLTQTISGLMKQSGFNPHSSTTTTLRYYVDYQNYSLIDNVFNINFSNSFQDESEFHQSSIKAIFDAKGNFREQSCSIPFQNDIFLPSKIPLDKQVLEDNLQIELIVNPQLNIIKQNMFINSSLNSKQKVAESFLGDTLSKVFLTMFELTYCNYFKLLASFMAKDIIVVCNSLFIKFRPNEDYCHDCYTKAYQVIYMNQRSNRNPFNFGNQIKRISKQIEQNKEMNQNKFQEQTTHKIVLQDDKQNQSIIFLPFIQQNQNRNEELVSLRQLSSKKEYSFLLKGQECKIKDQSLSHVVIISQHQSKVNNTFTYTTMQSNHQQDIGVPGNRLSLRIQQLSSKIKLQRQPYCKGCSSLRVQLCQVCDNNKFKACCECELLSEKCNCSKEPIPNIRDVFSCYYGVNYFDNQELDLFTPFDLSYKKPPYLDRQNNIKECITKDRVFLTKMASSTSITQRIHIPWRKLPHKLGKMVDEVRQNELFLPLSILKFKNKGFGVVAVEKIPKNTIIATYLGVIRPHYQAQLHDNSLLSIGWCGRTQFYVTCLQASNVGRYFNCSDSKNPANCTIQLAMVDNDNFCPYFKTIRVIQPGQEILWDYGPHYPKTWL